MKGLIYKTKQISKRLLPTLVKNAYYAAFPLVGSLVYGFASRKIKIIGVTGTDGKSSTVIFLSHILKKAGYKVGHFSSVSYSEGEEEKVNGFKMTMPGRFFLQRFIKKLVDNKCDFAVIEVTSEGIKQKRHKFINFDAAVITNLNPEHIESHGGFDNYKSAKKELFKGIAPSYKKGIPKTLIINGDYENIRDFAECEADKIVKFGSTGDVDLKVEFIEQSVSNSTFKLIWKNHTSTLKIVSGGPFIIQNIVAAVAAALALGVDFDKCTEAVKSISNPPGRFQIVSLDPYMIVDYAHTTAAVEMLLSFIRKSWAGEIIHVFGAAGGGRDKWKRPLLAQISEKYSDFSILTEENSFDEPTINIINDIKKGFKNSSHYEIVERREDAVLRAIQISKNLERPLVLLTAKGSETVIAGPNGTKRPYNEAQYISCILNDTYTK
jgi:UDP-N-acetylmuramyl-tripeptide synthetase